MRARHAACAFAALACLFATDAARAQRTTLQILIRGTNANPARPTSPVNNLQELSAAFAACWSPPPPDRDRAPVDVIFQVSFKRSGELFGKPRIVEFVRPVTPEERGRYYAAVAEAIDRCSPMPFTEAMGGAVAGRVFRVNFIDMRNRKQAEVPWPITKS
ncbi:MAG: hypothetical protein E6G97_23735 [Alphaproteobacteria bacterium]|nr:MAG: hypothetical protein E6G97_23735 [Alphaproteobacteria bacterium]